MKHDGWIEGCYTTVAYHGHDGPMMHDWCWDTIEEVDIKEIEYDDSNNILIVKIEKTIYTHP
jgi:hypothetical protein